MIKNSLKRAFSWYFSKGALPYWSILVIDCVIMIVAGLVAFTLNHGATSTAQVFYPLVGTLCLYLVVYIVCFRIFHTYSGIIRFSSFVDLQRMGIAIMTGTLIVLVLQGAFALNHYLAELWVADIVLAALMALIVMWTVRIWVKRIYDVTESQHKTTRAFIYGVMSGGTSLAKSIREPGSPFSLEGFVSDAEDLSNKLLFGKPVVYNDSRLVEKMKAAGATALLVSPLKSNALRDNNEMINSLLYNGIRIYMMPRAMEWDGSTDLSHSQLKEVKIEDLLPRAEIEVDMEAIGNMLRGKRILVTGAAGSIGSEIARQIAGFGPDKLVLVDQGETPLHDIRLMMARKYGDVDAPTIVVDICNKERMAEIFAKYKPQYVFHAAAYKHVPMMEDNPMEAIRNNVYGTRVVADLAVAEGAEKFVMVSTDKAVNPTNVMGCSKRICEIYVQSLDNAIREGKVEGHTRFVTTRFGNVLGSNGSVIPLFKEQIKNGGPVTVTHPDIIRFFMLIPEACKLVLEAGSMGTGGEIFVFDMGKPVRIADLARRMITLSGAEGVEIKFTGLRDGEKLYEEVLNDKEITLPTFHEKIKIAKVREYDYFSVSKDIDRLVADALLFDDMLTVKEMKEIVPEFVSQHSKYEVLDRDRVIPHRKD
ncbi:MAG: polysaccharide biosynthesis protein [Bacteroides sp.]|nr:polysaccharide biosynthesis protein [Bacteroides sp.]